MELNNTRTKITVNKISSNADRCNLRNAQGWNNYHYSYLTLLWDPTTRYQAVLGRLQAQQSD